MVVTSHRSPLDRGQADGLETIVVIGTAADFCVTLEIAIEQRRALSTGTAVATRSIGLPAKYGKAASGRCKIAELKYKPVRHNHKEFVVIAGARKGFVDWYMALSLEYPVAGQMLKTCSRAQQREWRYTQPEGGENGQNSYQS